MIAGRGVTLTVEEQKATGHFVHLDSKDEYSNYFRLVTKVIGRVLEWIAIEGDGDTVIRSMKPMIDRLLYTINLLRIRFLYNPRHNLALDLNQSGFPHSAAIFGMETDLGSRDKFVSELPKVDGLKDLLVDGLLQGREVNSILEELGESSYFALLEQERLFLPFTVGTLERLQCADDKVRRYNFTWATYSTDVNVPYFHSLLFEQDSDFEPLENGGGNYNKFIETLKFCSQHSPQLGVLIYQIDDGIGWIHPKMIQRIQIGPLFANIPRGDEIGSRLSHLLLSFGQTDDFILELITEVVISKGSQKERSGIFSLGQKKVREIFFLPGDNLELYERRVSRVVKKLMLPHHVLQNVDRNAEYFKGYRSYGKITYTTGGPINVH
jgi:hypothetical protein